MTRYTDLSCFEILREHGILAQIRIHSFFKAIVEKSEQLCSEISKTLEEIQRGKQQFTEFNSDKVRNCLKENASLTKENKDLKQVAMDLEKKLNEHRKGGDVLKEQLMKTEAEKQELLKEVHSLNGKIQEKSARR